MPGKSSEDFEVGQWVIVAFPGDKYSGKIGNIVQIRGVPDGSIAKYILEYKDGGRGQWGHATSLYTAKETEELMYHCSYCGTEGHNRRTCPKALSEGTITGEDMKVEYSRGDRVDPSFLSSGDLFMVEKGAAPDYWRKGVFKVTKLTSEYVISSTVDNGGEAIIGSFGKTWNFSSEEWTFYRVVEIRSGVETIKDLPIWDLIEIVLPVSRLTLLYGPPGTGKTTAGNFCGEPKEVYNITLTEETPAAELRGHFIPKGNEFIWMDGPALTAFKTGGRLVLNEIDKASGDALTFCHALLDDPGIANITLPYKDDLGKSVSVKPHPAFNVVATMNGEPEDLPEALRDRFSVRINVDKVHPNAIKSLPADLQKIASKGISKDGDRSVSIRGWNAFVQLRELIGEHNAARAVFGSRADTILNTVKIDSMSKKK